MTQNTDHQDAAQEHAGPESAMKPAKAPVGAGSAPLVAQLIALALVALGVVGVQEALVRTGAISSSSWTSAVVPALDGIRYDDPVVLVVAVVLALVGLLVLPMALLRRPRKAVALEAGTGVYLRTRDLARVAGAAVEGADAVTDVHVKAGRRTLKVRATTVAARDRNDEITADLRDRLASSLGALERTPRVKVSVRNEGLS